MENKKSFVSKFKMFAVVVGVMLMLVGSLFGSIVEANPVPWHQSGGAGTTSAHFGWTAVRIVNTSARAVTTTTNITSREIRTLIELRTPQGQWLDERGAAWLRSNEVTTYLPGIGANSRNTINAFHQGRPRTGVSGLSNISRTTSIVRS